MFDTKRLSTLSTPDVEFALIDSFDKDLFDSFEKHKAAGTLDFWFNTKLSSLEKQQLVRFMEGRK